MKELIGQIYDIRLDGNIKFAVNGKQDPVPEYDGIITIEGDPIPIPTPAPEYDGTLTVAGDPVPAPTVPEYDGTVKIAPGDIEIVPWSTGTDEEIAAMVAALDNGTLSVEDTGWAVGDMRSVRLGTGESLGAQTVKFVLSHPGATAGISRADGKPIHFQVDQVNCLNERGRMNRYDTSIGSWDGCTRRAWCNSSYYNAIPETLRPIFKAMKVTTAENFNGSALKESEDFFALRAAKEIFGSASCSNSAEAAALEQVQWYKTTANRKKLTSNASNDWWERSPYAGNSGMFCYVETDGSARYFASSGNGGIAPFGCI